MSHFFLQLGKEVVNSRQHKKGMRASEDKLEYKFKEGKREQNRQN